MFGMRHEETKRQPRRLGGAACFAVLLLAALAGLSAQAATSRLVWSDSVTGFAIGGFDPLTFFTTRRPKQGSADFEYDWKGVTWRFVNEGNRKEFMRYPEIYAPQFGGYDAYAMTEGKMVEGNPNIWMKQKQRIYMFSTRKNRALWLIRRDDKIAIAKDIWTSMQRYLQP